MRIHRLLLVVAAASLPACGSSPPQDVSGDVSTSRAQRRQAVEEVARLTSQAVQNASLTTACNVSHAPPELSRALIVTARQGYTCDDVGYAIRRLRQGSSRDLWILTSEADAEEVCRYLRQERLRAPVALLPPNVLSTEVRDDLIYFEISASGDINIVEAANGSGLLQSLKLNEPNQRRIP
jgi:hypothetical protein